ncbi:MAG: archease [Deltaproteobacteria bacterium]|nr:archease [Deltaproteobacteria bacterium]
MAYRVFDHTADLGVEVTAATQEELYAGAAIALFDLMADLATVRAGTSRKVAVAGEDAADLLVNFLRALLDGYNGDGFLTKACLVTEIDSRRLRAFLKGERCDPARHRMRMEIKAVTYHQISVEQTGDEWVARVVFDV